MIQAAATTDRRPLSEQVADAIMRHILEENLVPGDRLPTEPELIDSFDVSRTVIREAGRTLIARGIVTIRPRRGMEVAEFDQRNLSRQVALMLRLGGGTFTELMEMRQALEPDMAAYAALRRTQDDIDELRRLVELIGEGHSLETQEEREAHIAADLDFHSVIARATGNPFFAHMALPFNEILFATYSTSPGYTPERGKTHDEHAGIAEAIEARDVEQARALALSHIQRVTDAAEKLTPSMTLKGTE